MRAKQFDYASAVETLIRAAVSRLCDGAGNLRAEDLISSLAAVTGELVVRTVPRLDVEISSIAPGGRIRSPAIAETLSGGETDWARIPPESAFGGLHEILRQQDSLDWPQIAFPDVAEIYRLFDDALTGDEDWGWAPLSVPERHWPRRQPLLCAHVLRPALFASGAAVTLAPKRAVAIGYLSMLKALTATKEAIRPSIALRLAFETVNAMARTMPLIRRRALVRTVTRKDMSG